MREQIETYTPYRCPCGAYVGKLYECDFCHEKFCWNCFAGAAMEVNGGFGVRDTGWNCCYGCAEQDEVQIEILKEAKANAEGQLGVAEDNLELAKQKYREVTNDLAGVIDEINQKLKELKNEL